MSLPVIEGALPLNIKRGWFISHSTRYCCCHGPGHTIKPNNPVWAFGPGDSAAVYCNEHAKLYGAEKLHQ
jgi:hypothetical protein